MSSDERHLAEQEAHAQALVDVAYWRERAERAEAEAGHMEVRGDQWKDAAERAEQERDDLLSTKYDPLVEARFMGRYIREKVKRQKAEAEVAALRKECDTEFELREQYAEAEALERAEVARLTKVLEGVRALAPKPEA